MIGVLLRARNDHSTATNLTPFSKPSKLDYSLRCRFLAPAWGFNLHFLFLLGSFCILGTTPESQVFSNRQKWTSFPFTFLGQSYQTHLSGIPKLISSTFKRYRYHSCKESKFPVKYIYCTACKFLNFFH